jgi:DMSO/TMAO reductase YedYZ molybdopterin-dependent catalytic subunit
MSNMETTRRAVLSRPLAAVAGVLAAGGALGTGEFLAGASRKVPSLVVAVADLFVDKTPGGIVRWSIRTFGHSQKAILVTGVVMVSLLIGAFVGVAARRNLMPGVFAFAGFAAVGALAGAREPGSSPSASWVSAALAAGVGVGALALTLRPRVPAAPAAQPMRRPGDEPDRRWFLAASGITAVWALTGTAIGRRLRDARNVSDARNQVAAQLGGSGPPEVPAGVATFDSTVEGISPLITPNADFYRIDTALIVPEVDPGDWTLRIVGMVDKEVTLTFDDLVAMERMDDFVTLQCVSNEVGGDLVGNAQWSGVSLPKLLDMAGVHPDATQIVGRSVDDWTGGFPTEIAYDGRAAMVAIAMNGEPLPVEHGFPARLVVPGLYGYVSATKWLKEIELTTLEAFDGYWVPRGWAKLGPIKTESRIDVPRAGATVKAGKTAMAGVAWAPTRGISKVEVRVDDGAWQAAKLSGALADTAWLQWLYEWDAPKGDHVLAVRATDGTGATQTDKVAPPAPTGATGYHAVQVTVR